MATFGVEFAVLFVLTEWISLHYLIGAAAGFTLGTVLLYKLSIHWVFYTRRIGNRQFEFSAFTGLSLLAMAANGGLLLIFVELLSIHYLAARVTAALCVFIANFTVKKLLMF